jgi:hypothetical protein
MPKLNNNFLKGKMNLDLDDKIIPKGEYREAGNISVTKSEGSDSGTVEQLKGFEKITNFSSDSSLDGSAVIGAYFDNNKKRIIFFTTDFQIPSNQYDSINKVFYPGFDNLPGQPGGVPMAPPTALCSIYCWEKGSATAAKIVTGSFLNFSITHPINNINIIEDQLFWTDNLNQPRKINISTAKTTPTFYNAEHKISVAKFAPVFAPMLLDYTYSSAGVPTGAFSNVSSMNESAAASIDKDYLKEKFVRFSYRFRFSDGEYSTMAPFTNTCFVPKSALISADEEKEIAESGEVSFYDTTSGQEKGMINKINQIDIYIKMPSQQPAYDYDITGLEILYKQSDEQSVKSLELVNLVGGNENMPSDGMYKYVYNSILPTKTLPEKQITRVYDNVPYRAETQEMSGNRIMYGNFQQDRDLIKTNGVAGLNYVANYNVKYNDSAITREADYAIHKEYPLHSIKSRRSYQIGVVLADKYGRQSPVLLSTTGAHSVYIPARDENFYNYFWNTTGSGSNGNANYCGDALECIFNQPIQEPYASPTILTLPGTNTSPGANWSTAVSQATPSSTTIAERLTITNGNATTEFAVGRYLKGQSKDFVGPITSSTYNGTNTVIEILHGLDDDQQISGVYHNLSPQSVDTDLFAYDINPYGWYSYRIVVKQNQQEYYNVYTPGIIDLENENGEFKSYVQTGVGGNINKIPRDPLADDIQELNLGTSSVNVFPKVIRLADTPNPIDGNSDSDLMSILNIGTARQQDLVNANDIPSAFLYEANKNMLVSQIPYKVSTTGMGVQVSQSDLKGTDISFSAKTSPATNEVVVGKTDFTVTVKGVDLSSTGTNEIAVGDYLKGRSTDLVKVESIIVTTAPDTVITCDNFVSEEEYNVNTTEAISIKKYSYALDPVLHTFETEPFESVLDIYYETSTSGYVHELNELSDVAVEPSYTLFTKDATTDFRENEDYTIAGTYVGEIRIYDTKNNLLAPAPAGIINSLNLNSVKNSSRSTVTSDFEFEAASTGFKIKTLTNKAFTYDLGPANYTFNFDVIYNTTQTLPGLTASTSLKNVAPQITSSNQFTLPGQSPPMTALDHAVTGVNGSIINQTEDIVFELDPPFYNNNKQRTAIANTYLEIHRDTGHIIAGNTIPGGSYNFRVIIKDANGSYFGSSAFQDCTLTVDGDNYISTTQLTQPANRGEDGCNGIFPEVRYCTDWNSRFSRCDGAYVDYGADLGNYGGFGLGLTVVRVSTNKGGNGAQYYAFASSSAEPLVNNIITLPNDIQINYCQFPGGSGFAGGKNTTRYQFRVNKGSILSPVSDFEVEVTERGKTAPIFQNYDYNVTNAGGQGFPVYNASGSVVDRIGAATGSLSVGNNILLDTGKDIIVGTVTYRVLSEFKIGTISPNGNNTSAFVLNRVWYVRVP